MVNYQRRQPQEVKKCGGLKHFCLCFFSFFMGYGFALMFNQEQLLAWVKRNVFVQTKEPVASVEAHRQDIPKPNFEFYTLLTQDPKTGEMVEHPLPQGTQVVQQEVQSLPVAQTVVPTEAPVVALDEKAKQTSEKVAAVISSYEQAMVPHESSVFAETAATSMTLPAANASVKGGYLLQLAAFSRLQEAQKMSHSLKAKGFSVSVVPVNQQQMVWYRVVLGPFASRMEAERAQTAMVRAERITGMIKRSDI